MKRKLVRLLLVVLLFSVWDATPALADGGAPEPICYPGTPCAAKLFDGGEPVPICFPGRPCATR